MESPARPDATFTPRRVSTIVPAFDYGRFLPDAIDSALTQSVSDLEVIVVDDHSTDDTVDIVARYGDRVRYVRQPSQFGSGAAANRGVAVSTGEFLTFLDADDCWTNGKLATQLAVLDADARVDAVFGHAEEFFSPELDGATRALRTLRHLPAPVAGTMMVRRSAYFRVGGFAEGVVLGEFLDWYARAIDRRLVTRMLPDVFLRRRVHATNLSRTSRSAHQDYVRVLKQSLDRRRAAGADVER
jgi:glycosyltransferase involved in cell wall biosynthesis